MSDHVPPGPGVSPSASRWIVLGMVLLIAASGLAVAWLKPSPAPPPSEIAGNPRLVAGREIFLARCANCHGEQGKGNGPLAKGLAGPAPRNLVADEWKHGDRPEQVLVVLSQGVSGTAMGGWSSSLDADQLRSVAAYVYHLAGRPVPPALR